MINSPTQIFHFCVYYFYDGNFGGGGDVTERTTDVWLSHTRRDLTVINWSMKHVPFWNANRPSASKKLVHFYETWSFIAVCQPMFTLLFQLNSEHTLPLNESRLILILSSNLFRSSRLFFLLHFPNKIWYLFVFLFRSVPRELRVHWFWVTLLTRICMLK
jgi:hypothetical protein